VDQAWLKSQILTARQSAKTPTENAAAAFLRSIPQGASLTEYLLTSPDAFGISTATPAQRAVCRVLDGVPLGELAQHPDVQALLGFEEGEPHELPAKQPDEVCFLAAIRCAKTITALAKALGMALTVDVSGIKPSETVRVPIVSLTLDKANESHATLSGVMTSSPMLKPLLIGNPTAGSFTVMHPSGRAVEIAIAAGKKAGGSLIGIWLAGVVFDEAPRMDGAEDAVVNLDHARQASIGRILNGGQTLMIGSPWAPHGPVYDLVQQAWGEPTDRTVVLRGTGPMLNPVLWTPDRCAKLLETNEAAYQTDVAAEFTAAEGGLVSLSVVRRNTRADDGEDLPRNVRAQYFAAMDPSDGTEEGNPWTLVVVERATVVVPVTSPDDEPALAATGAPITRIRNRFSVVAVREWRGMRPADVVKEAAQACARYGVREADTDQHAGAALQDLAKIVGFSLRIVPWTSANRTQAYTDMATLAAENLIEFHPNKEFQRDLLSVRKRKTQRGYTIVLPRMGGGRHCDFAPALAAAIAKAGSAAQRLEDIGGAGTGTRWGSNPGRGFG